MPLPPRVVDPAGDLARAMLGWEWRGRGGRELSMMRTGAMLSWVSVLARLNTQPLVTPYEMELEAADEMVVAENLEVSPTFLPFFLCIYLFYPFTSLSMYLSVDLSVDLSPVSCLPYDVDASAVSLSLTSSRNPRGCLYPNAKDTHFSRELSLSLSSH